jgi:hypothetical protein
VLKVIGGLVGVLLASGIMTTQGVITEGADTTPIGVNRQHLEKVNPEWTADEAAIWVQHNIRVSLENCPDPMCFHEHPTLYEFNWNPEDYSVIPSRFRRGIAELASRTQVRDALFFDDCPCWFVELRSHEEEPYGFQFYAWEDGYVVSFMYNEHYGD